MESSFQSVDTTPEAVFAEDIHRVTGLISRTAQWRLYLVSLILVDVCCTGLAFVAAGWVRFYVPLPIFNLTARPSVPSTLVVVLGFIPLWITIFAAQGLYQRRNLLGGLQEYSAVFRATAIGMLVIVILGFLRPIYTPARGWVVLAWVFAIVFITVGRFVLRRAVYYLRTKGLFLTPALIIGANAEARSLAEQLLHWRKSGLAVVGFICDRTAAGAPVYRGKPVLGGINDLDSLVDRYAIEELILATSALSQDEVLTVFKRFGMRREMNLRLSSGLFEVITTGLEVKEIASVPLMRVNQSRLAGYDWLLKGILDLTLGFALFIVFLPLFVIIPIAIRLDSPGPIIYRRRVMGLNGRPFDAFKFRTMDIDGDALLAGRPELQAELDRDHKLKDDPRVTRVGRVLRKHSLDELPQFFNVFRREMSVVGPRMISPEEVVLYEQWDINLLTVLPGITGLWQVSGRSDVAYSERVRLDMRYIRNWSIWLDLQILMQTVMVVLTGHGAY